MTAVETMASTLTTTGTLEHARDTSASSRPTDGEERSWRFGHEAITQERDETEAALNMHDCAESSSVLGPMIQG